MNAFVFYLLWTIHPHPHPVAGQQPTAGRYFIDPTGTYEYDGPLHLHRGELTDNGGEILVRLLDKGHVSLDCYLHGGPPHYPSVSFHKDLRYKGNDAVYQPANPESCPLIFTVLDQTILVFEGAQYSNRPCTPENGVNVSGIYRKISRHSPYSRDPFVKNEKGAPVENYNG